MPMAPAMPLPRDATATLYVEGIPDDASEREMAHLFRPFDGFEVARLVPHAGRNGRKMYLCFAEFRSPGEAFASMQVLHNYDIDPREAGAKRLRISFARKPPRSPVMPAKPQAKPAASGTPAKAPGAQAQAQARPSGRRDEDQPAWARKGRTADAAAGRDEDRALAAAMDAKSGESQKGDTASDAIAAVEAAPEAESDAERPE